MEKFDQAKNVLKEHAQEHLLANYEKLDEKRKETLIEQILRIDFIEIEKLYQSAENTEVAENVIEPTPYMEKEKLEEEELNKHQSIGEEELRKGNYAVVTMAGGQRNKTRTQPDLKGHLC